MSPGRGEDAGGEEVGPGGQVEEVGEDLVEGGLAHLAARSIKGLVALGAMDASWVMVGVAGWPMSGGE